MKTFDVRCPVCGHMNHNLFLEETDGWMECEKCNATTRSLKSEDTIRIPLKSLKTIKPQIATA